MNDTQILKEVKSFGFLTPTPAVRQAITLTRQAEQKRILDLIDKRIKANKNCDKQDTYDEQHSEHLVVIAELEELKEGLKSI
jgi:hypothetical protein